MLPCDRRAAQIAGARRLSGGAWELTLAGLKLTTYMFDPYSPAEDLITDEEVGRVLAACMHACRKCRH